jgi:hypothetical protein
MARTNNPEDTVKVGEIPKRANVTTGKPQRIITSAMRLAACGTIGGGGGGGGGIGGYGGVGGGSYVGSGGNFYSPELSTDFLELPQSLDELRNYYRHFYENDPFVGQAVDLHSELPLSKLRIRMPEARSRELAEKSTRFCERWAKKIKLLHRLIEFVHDFSLLGEVFIFAEDTSPDMPRDIREQPYREIAADGEVVEQWQEREDADERAVKWLKKHYSGWTALRALPPEQIHMESFPFTDERLIELIPDSKTKAIIQKADQGDVQAKRIVDSQPQEVVNAVRAGRNIPFNTDPEAGSFVYYMARKRAQYEPRGKSMLQRVLRVLVYRDKLRQAQTSIASRHMTPYRIVYGEDLSLEQVDELREQVDLALMDPDYSIITNFAVTWEERGGGADSRLLELSSEYDMTDRQMYAGLGVTESLLSGESSYSGDRIHLEVINTRYMLLRELLQDFVEEYLFKPMCARMGFIEEDEDGEEVVIHPKLSFTRLAIRDNSETFDALFNLYQKGSIDIDVILDLLNIDPITTLEKLKRDLMTLNDPTFNEVLRSVYSRVGDSIAENSDAAEKIADTLGLKYSKPDEGGGRF